jgi:molybdate transport system ATP-binding protein
VTVSLSGVTLSLVEFDLEADGEVARGWTGLVGPSGAGKTSLLEMIAGFRAPGRGAIAIEGDVVFHAEQRIDVAPRRRGIGYVTQDDTLFPHRTVRDNLSYGMARAGNAASELERTAALLSVDSLLERPVTTLSGGEKRRVALARALLSRPRLLLLDEPLTGLDPVSRDRVMGSLRLIHREFPMPTIYVAHNPEEILGLCDDALVLERGRIRRRDTPRKIFDGKVFAATDAADYS